MRNVKIKENEMNEIKFYERCQAIARRKGYRQEIVDDFPSWAMEKYLTGRKATPDQLFVDYLRSFLGLEGSENQKVKKSLESNRDEALSFVASVENVDLFEVVDLLKTLVGRDQEMMNFYFIEGFTKKEIADKYGLSEARVSQCISKVVEQLKVLV